jgi:SAM-dependent methyltransferase
MTDPVALLSESWDARAQDWIKWVRAPGQPDSYWRFHRDRFLSLVPAPGQLTVDIGCGEGRVGRDLRDRGHTVLGIDRSKAMVNAAVAHPEAAPAIVGDAVRLPLADASADCAIAFMSLQDIDKMDVAVKEAARVLKDGRPLVLAVVHPMYSGGSFSDGAGSDRLFVMNRPYFVSGRCTGRDSHDDLTMVFDREHRPLEAYTEALNQADFIIKQLYEVTDKESEPRSRVPMFLDILAERIPRHARTDAEPPAAKDPLPV